MTCNILLSESNNEFQNSGNLFSLALKVLLVLFEYLLLFFHQKQSDLFIKSLKYFRNNFFTISVSEKIANRFWWFNFFYLETDIPPKDKKLSYIFVGSKKSNIFHTSSKVIYPKYSKHWLYTVAHTIDCVCSKMLNHGLNHGLLLSLFKLIPCPIVYMLAYF